MFKQVIDLYELMDNPKASGLMFKKYLDGIGKNNCRINTIKTDKGSTDFIKTIIPGRNGKMSGGNLPTLGVIGRLGGLGARPNSIGFVSDGDGALSALAVTAKLIKMNLNGDQLKGDVIVSTHICPDAPVIEHKPVDFMDSPVDMETMNRMEVDNEMDAILSVDATKGNRVINHNGFALSNTVKSGYILKSSEDLLDIMTRVTGESPYVFPLSQQDISPYRNNLYHLNSILQPSTSTEVPVVGVAITSNLPVAGCATGATNLINVEKTSRFIVEVAKEFTNENCRFYDKKEYKKLVELYGSMTKFQTAGKI